MKSRATQAADRKERGAPKLLWRPSVWAVFRASAGVRDGWISCDSLAHMQLGEAARVPASTELEHQLRELAVKRPTVRVILPDDDEYPRSLRKARGCPALLFIDGEFEPSDGERVAIVGSRATSSEGLNAAKSIAAELARLGVGVVSGLARGVDAAAHEGALAGGGRTVAVIGTGIDVVYPPEHVELDARIRRSGSVVSQFRPGAPPTKTSFPSRNNVIAGLARATIVIDAGEYSGTRITIDRTLEQDKPVIFWAPILGLRSWVVRLVASDPRAQLVDSVEDILAIVRRVPVP